jgi:hypothetical protein
MTLSTENGGERYTYIYFHTVKIQSTSYFRRHETLLPIFKKVFPRRDYEYLSEMAQPNPAFLLHAQVP